MNISLKRLRFLPKDVFPSEIFFITGMYLLYLFLFEVIRGVMLFRNYSLASHLPGVLILKSFLVGLRFDLAISSYILIPVLLCLYIFAGRLRAYVLILATVLLSAIMLVCLAEVEFYRELQMRFNANIFEYSTHLEIVGGMVWEGYPVVRYLLFWVFLSFVAAACTFLLYMAFLREKRYVFERPSIAKGVTGVATFALMIFALRGGFQGEPLRWGDAYFSDEAFANNLALNGAFTLGRSALDKLSDKKDFWGAYGNYDDALKLTKDMVMLPSEQDLSSKDYPILRSESTVDASALMSKTDKPVNVVVILMESYSGRLVGALGNKRNITPEFDALSKDGVLFARAFSNGSHTHQGVFASLTSFPNLPGFEYLMKSTYAAQEFSGLPTILTSRAYDSVFLYNGLFSWDNKEGFFRQHGIKKFVGTDDYVKPVFVDPVWGVSDEDVFRRANEEFREMAKKGPFFGAILTLSNHSPFNLPPLKFTRVISNDAYQNRYNAMKYSDWALGEFFRAASKEEYFKNTIFVITGDHGIGTSEPITHMSLEKLHVPILFYSPLLKQKGIVRGTVASHVDIGPSVLGLIGVDTPHQAWGRNLFSPSLKDNGFAVIKHSGGDDNVAIVEDDRILIVGPKEKPVYYSYDLGMPPKTVVLSGVEEDRKKLMQEKLRAYVEAGISALKLRKVGVGVSAKKASNSAVAPVTAIKGTPVKGTSNGTSVKGTTPVKTPDLATKAKVTKDTTGNPTKKLDKTP